jgi:hypothetical protein
MVYVSSNFITAEKSPVDVLSGLYTRLWKINY